MRLIDADMLKKYMINNSKEVERFLGYIDEQPTAYNVDGVVKRLKALQPVQHGIITVTTSVEMLQLKL